MARKNEFKKIIIEHKDPITKKIIRTETVKNIVTLQCADGTKHYYANCMVNGVYYQKKNLTKYFGSRTLKQAKEHLEDAKSLMRKGINPFNNSLGDKIKDIVLAHIDSKKHMGKPSAYTKSLEGFYYNYVDPVIGHLKMEKVGDTHVQKIMKSFDVSTLFRTVF